MISEISEGDPQTLKLTLNQGETVHVNPKMLANKSPNIVPMAKIGFLSNLALKASEINISNLGASEGTGDITLGSKETGRMTEIKLSNSSFLLRQPAFVAADGTLKFDTIDLAYSGTPIFTGGIVPKHTVLRFTGTGSIFIYGDIVEQESDGSLEVGGFLKVAGFDASLNASIRQTAIGVVTLPQIAVDFKGNGRVFSYKTFHL